MLLEIVILLVALLIIVAAAELFTNGVEWLGQRLELSEGVVGSVLAAVGTALPETLIPIVAVVWFGGRHGDEVGIGAITGAPFMLSTLTLGLCGSAALIFAKMGRRDVNLNINHEVIARDLKFFILAYTLGILAAIPTMGKSVAWTVAVLIFLIYPVYLFKTFKSEGEVGEEPEHLYFDKILKIGSRKLRLILPQITIALIGIVAGAYLFVEYIQDIADDIGFPPLVLSLIVSPIATELPEKINSVLWVRNGKDTLALGNVTGALVFQSCIPVAFGIAFTSWDLDSGTMLTAITALICATCYLFLIKKKRLKPTHLMFGILAYAIAVTVLISLDASPAHTSGHH